MVKLTDVAREAEVSVATVSRALNNNETVDPRLAARVRAAAQKLGYRPNHLARNLRRQRTNLWLLIISDIENAFFTSVARGVEDAAVANEFSVALCNADEDEHKEARYVELAVAEQAAGVIVSPHSMQTDITPLTMAGIPVVVIDREARRTRRLGHRRLPRRGARRHRAPPRPGLVAPGLHHRPTFGADRQSPASGLRRRLARRLGEVVVRRPRAVHHRRRPRRGGQDARPVPPARLVVRRQRRPRPRRAAGTAGTRPAPGPRPSG